MSRRGRHGRHPHPHAGARPSRPSAAAPPRPAAPAPARPEPSQEPRPAPVTEAPALHGNAAPSVVPAPEPAPVAPEPSPVNAALVATVERPPVVMGIAPVDAQRGTTCTTAQLRRFIKSRPWIPMHELRRRFGIYGDDDEVNPLRVGEHTLFVGLPAAEAAMVGELLTGGDVGYELSLDPVTPVIVGVYPMRPVPRS